jgi:hypothetical protein
LLVHARKSEEANVKLVELVGENSIVYEGKVLFVQQSATFKTFLCHPVK